MPFSYFPVGWTGATLSSFGASLSRPTLDEMLALNCGELYVCVEVAAHGEVVDGVAKPYRFCTHRPTAYSAAEANIINATYKPWLTAWPSLLRSRAKFLGGIESAGQISFKLNDGDMAEPFWVSENFVDKNTPLGRSLPIGLNADSPFIAFDSSTGISEGLLIWLNGEVLQVGTLIGGVLWNIAARGVLGTEARAHKSTSLLYTSSQFTRSRRIKMYYGFQETGISDEREIDASWILDQKTLMTGLVEYAINAASQEKYLDRRILRVMSHLEDSDWIDEANDTHPMTQATLLMPITSTDQILMRDLQGPFFRPWAGPYFTDAVTPPGTDVSFRYAIVEDEVVGGALVYDSGTNAPRKTIAGIGDLSFYSLFRGLGGTKAKEHDKGEKVREILLADASLYFEGVQVGSFRHQHQSDGVATSLRTTGVWRVTDHPIAIAMIVMTSSADPQDGLELTNHNGKFNWSSLPAGWGIGIPIDNIDEVSALAIMERFPQWRSPNTVLGTDDQKDKTFTKWFEEEFGWTGVIIRIIDGKFTFTLPSDLLENDANALTITESDLGAVKQDDALVPQAEFVDRWDLVASKVIFKVQQDGRERTISFDESNFDQTIGQEGFYDIDERELTLNAKGVRMDEGGTEFVLSARALSLLLRYYLPPKSTEIYLPLSFDKILNVGDVHKVTHPQFPTATGRGWNLQPVLIHGKKQDVKPGKVGLAVEIITHSLPGKYGRVSATGAIVSVVLNGSDYDVTLAENRYTFATNALGLPVSDNKAFKVDQVLRLIDKKGTDIGAGTETVVVAPSGSTVLKISGNFSGNLAVGTGNAEDSLVFANFDEVIAGQGSDYAYFADADGKLGAGDKDPFNYTEG